jgi:hypothetical protein
MNVKAINDIPLISIHANLFGPLRQHRRSHSWASPEEAEILCKHIKECNIELVVEIGTSNGYTAACMATTGVRVLTFDLVDMPKLYCLEVFPYPELKNSIEFHPIPSPECFKHITLPKGPVMFFVDGAHLEEMREKDFERCREMARPGDLIFMHDVQKREAGANFWNLQVKKFPNSTTTFTGRNGLGLYKK